MSRSRIHIVASCTDRKRERVPPHLRLREYRESGIEETARRWSDALRSYSRRRLPAGELYCGEHWAVVRTLPDLVNSLGIEAHLWVASAGYGLVSVDAELAPYSATFASGVADSVSSAMTGPESPACKNRKWWQLLSNEQLLEHESPRSLDAILEALPADACFVVSSGSYLEAMEDQLSGAVGRLPDADALVLISNERALRGSRFGENLVPVSARMQSAVGGSRISLHARALRLIFSQGMRTQFRATALRDELLQRTAAEPELMKYERRVCSDDEVRAFIREHLTDSTRAWGPLLRAFRDAGLACEQSRFGRLFQAMREERYASENLSQ